ITKKTPPPQPLTNEFLSPADYCAGIWHGTLSGHVGSFFRGDEYYVTYQDPAEVGCTETYPFAVAKIIWPIYANETFDIELVPMIFRSIDVDGCNYPGDILYEGSPVPFEDISPGGQYIYIPLEDTVCIYEPYFIGFYVTDSVSGLDLYVDDGMNPAPRSCAVYRKSSTGSFWYDLVDFYGFEWNVCLWSEGFNYPEGRCSALCDLQTPGDADSDGFITSDDINFIVNNIYNSGPAPDPPGNGDANGDCIIDKGDAIAVMLYLEGTGDAPVDCTCPYPEKKCCYGTTGNVNCSWEENPDEEDVWDLIDISDITKLISNLYISHNDFCCLEEADINASGGYPDISDITRLIDFLYLTHQPLPSCP
ncbi:MAG: hypothetical protein ACOYVF_11125, partial [Candidatus Zixiibacteriota bacterium]